MLPIGNQVLLAESHNSALAWARGLLLLSPSVTSTLPVGRSVAVCSVRAGLILPAANQVLLAKSYSSALAWIGPLPPATSTRPESSRVAVWEVLAAVL